MFKNYMWSVLYVLITVLEYIYKFIYSELEKIGIIIENTKDSDDSKRSFIALFTTIVMMYIATNVVIKSFILPGYFTPSILVIGIFIFYLNSVLCKKKFNVHACIMFTLVYISLYNITWGIIMLYNIWVIPLLDFVKVYEIIKMSPVYILNLIIGKFLVKCMIRIAGFDEKYSLLK